MLNLVASRGRGREGGRRDDGAYLLISEWLGSLYLLDVLPLPVGEQFLKIVDLAL